MAFELKFQTENSAFGGNDQEAAKMTLKQAGEIAGNLSFPSKLPGSSYGLPARACLTGAKLVRVPGSTCAACYALKDAYTWPNAQKAQYRRLKAIAHPDWVKAMTTVLRNAHATPWRKIDLGKAGLRRGNRYRLNPMGFHRWHDSGDLQSLDHLAKICAVARATPEIRHWLPTREAGLLARFVKGGGTVPDNLTIRLSAAMVDGKPLAGAWPLTSTVHKASLAPASHLCPAPLQNNTCGSCRACWSRDVANVSYHIH